MNAQTAAAATYHASYGARYDARWNPAGWNKPGRIGPAAPYAAWAFALLALLCLPSLARSAEMATRSVARGKHLFETICAQCHSLDQNHAAPALRNVLGRTAGKAPGYFYSEALGASTLVWNRARLKAWLTDPEKVVPGQEMNFHLDQPRDREAVVAYLAAVSSQGPKRQIPQPRSQPNPGN